MSISSKCIPTCCFKNFCKFLLSLISFSRLFNLFWYLNSHLFSHQRCSIENVYSKISKNSQESTCVRLSFLMKLQAWNFVKKRLRHSCFPVNFPKFLREPFSTEQTKLFPVAVSNELMFH